MPSLIRFIVAIGLIIGAAYGSLYVLAEYFEPGTKEVTTRVDGVRIRRQ